MFLDPILEFLLKNLTFNNYIDFNVKQKKVKFNFLIKFSDFNEKTINLLYREKYIDFLHLLSRPLFCFFKPNIKNG